MYRTPVVGDVLQIPGIRRPQVVIESEHVESRDHTRGDSYHADTFVTMDKTTDGLPKVSPKIRKFVLVGAHLSLHGFQLVSNLDIKLLGTTSVRKKVVTSYAVGKSMRKPAAGA